MMLRQLVMGLVVATLSMGSVADTLWLDNGDRVSGKVEFLDAGKLVLRTEYAGTLSINTSRIRTFTSDEPVLVRLGNGDEYTVQLAEAEEPGQVMLRVPNRQPIATDIARIDRLLVPRPLVHDMVWEGDIDAELDIKDASGTEKRDVDVDIASSLQHGRWRHDMTLEYDRDYSNDVKTSHVLDASYDLNRFLDDHWFWAGRMRYKRDHIEELARQRQLGTGPGYQWWNNGLGRFETSVLLGRLWTEERDGTRDKYDALGLQWDYRRYLLGKRFELFHNAEVQLPADPAVRYQLDTELGLRYRLTSWASLSLKGELDYLNTTDETGYRDTRYTLGVGVGW
ncbi:DUF481 domain-containing protein [Halopseudomonas pachastrellae]|uniref:DUF481 domain-containing protein n=1 Tax=Halopseudomonas pachastrellae TaxID=254161 RepID=UPI003D7DB0DF